MNDPRRPIGSNEVSYILAAIINGEKSITTYMSPYQPPQPPVQRAYPVTTGTVFPSSIDRLIGKIPA
jgi:hypothetical protein